MTKREGPDGSRPSTPRVTPLPEADWDDRTRELLGRAGVTGGRAVNIFATLVRHPRLFRHWLPFGGALLTGSLPSRDRELLILRTAWRCAAAYEWGQHVAIAMSAGVSPEEIHRIAAGPGATGWSAHDATLLRAADELHDGSCISDSTWTALADQLDEQQLVEVPMLVGQYHLVAFTVNSLGVQLEPGGSGLPPAPPAP